MKVQYIHGTTEEYCVPILESKQIKLNKGFVVGYNRERINRR